ncbi:adenine-specific methyltransferase EcoRI family protein [Mycoplasma seminis]|uniref:Adenine-specific methyltransferase EcoRI family protein n=1 Tax=Mycoplasma seminis TaxID=512749 RepID=A0ABY9H9L1_9MOLU|nr:adenine-specific methyltransferase EcoRI family protein [Mycoplasma seminis]WLP85270.1 adenine-specific methyltransferase EcoRI family protein [Mycoplasma seminis]
MAINFAADWNKRVEEINNWQPEKLADGYYQGYIIDGEIKTVEKPGERFKVVEVHCEILTPEEFKGRKVRKTYYIDDAYKLAWKVEKDHREFDEFLQECGKSYTNERELVNTLYDLKDEKTGVLVRVDNVIKGDKTYQNITLKELKKFKSEKELESKHLKEVMKQERKEEIGFSVDDLFNINNNNTTQQEKELDIFNDLQKAKSDQSRNHIEVNDEAQWQDSKAFNVYGEGGIQKNLVGAQRRKFDEFYTPLSVVSDELEIWYKKDPNFLRDKIVWLPCDEIERELFGKVNENTASQFWVYLHKNFKRFGIKKLIATFKNMNGAPAYKYEYSGGEDNNIWDYKKNSLKFWRWYVF